MRTVTVVGASLAGWRAAQELREQGFDGRLVIVGDEPHTPYDRPQLSKDLLTGKWEPDDLTLGDTEEMDELDAEWRLGRRARALNPRSGSVLLDDDTTVRTDGVVIATGAARATIPGAGQMPGSHLMYTIDDAQSLRAEIHSGARVVVVGGGLIGAEVASACYELKARTTVVDTRHIPLVPTFGIELAPMCFDLHEDAGR